MAEVKIFEESDGVVVQEIDTGVYNDLKQYESNLGGRRFLSEATLYGGLGLSVLGALGIFGVATNQLVFQPTSEILEPLRSLPTVLSVAAFSIGDILVYRSFDARKKVAELEESLRNFL